MAKLKGIKNMSMDEVKVKPREEAVQTSEGVKIQLRKKRTFRFRHGNGKAKPYVIMKDNGGNFVNVKRNDVLTKLDHGWKTVPRSIYRLAVRGGEIAAEQKVKPKKKKSKKKS